MNKAKVIIFTDEENISVSLMAKKIFTTHNSDPSIIAKSRGLLADEDKYVNENVAKILMSNNIHVGKRKAKMLTDNDIKTADMIILMEQNQKNAFFDQENVYFIGELCDCSDIKITNLNDKDEITNVYNYLNKVIINLIEKEKI